MLYDSYEVYRVIKLTVTFHLLVILLRHKQKLLTNTLAMKGLLVVPEKKLPNFFVRENAHQVQCNIEAFCGMSMRLGS